MTHGKDGKMSPNQLHSLGALLRGLALGSGFIGIGSFAIDQDSLKAFLVLTAISLTLLVAGHRVDALAERRHTTNL